MAITLEASYERIIKSLVECDFLFSANDFSADRQKADSEYTRKFIGVLNNLLLPIRLRFGGEEFQKSLDGIRTYVDIVCFRYVLSQPVITAVVFADALTDAQQEIIFRHFDDATLKCRTFTSSMGRVISTKLSVTGIILWCFVLTPGAQRFIDGRKAKLRKMHFWEKVNTLSWCVDLGNGTLTKHNGLPLILNSVFDAKTFARCLSADS